MCIVRGILIPGQYSMCECERICICMCIYVCIVWSKLIYGRYCMGMYICMRIHMYVYIVRSVLIPR